MVRSSRGLSYRRVHATHHAQKFARLQGVPLNISVTVNLRLAGVVEEQASTFVSKLISQRFCPWFRRAKANRHSVPPTYIWVRESKGGPGLHWALHIPKDMKTEFLGRLPIWVRALAGQQLPSNAIHTTSVYNCHGLRLYMLKGAEPGVAEQFGIDPIPQGLVLGSRSGVSRNLQRRSRSNGGYKPRRWRRQ
jgi:hypothetical protein